MANTTRTMNASENGATAVQLMEVAAIANTPGGEHVDGLDIAAEDPGLAPALQDARRHGDGGRVELGGAGWHGCARRDTNGPLAEYVRLAGRLRRFDLGRY
jgi:hypothetical protein